MLTSIKTCFCLRVVGREVTTRVDMVTVEKSVTRLHNYRPMCVAASTLVLGKLFFRD